MERRRRILLFASVLATTLVVFAATVLPGFFQVDRESSDTFDLASIYEDPSEFTSFYAYDLFKPTCAKQLNCSRFNLVVNEYFTHTEWRPRFIRASIPDLTNSSLLILRVEGVVEHGRQYDRPLWIFINGIPLFWGSTTMHSNFTSEIDVTLFKSLFRGLLNVTIYLPNWVIPELGLTGVFKINVSLLTCSGVFQPGGIPDYFIPLWSEELFRDVGPENTTSTTVRIPEDACRVFLFLRVKGRGREEFWYREIPSLRNILVYYDSELIGVHSPFPVIYTGGFFPSYWNPQPSLNTLTDKTLYFFDLTPLALNKRVGNLTLVVVGINESSGITGGVHQFHVTGGLAIWRCRSKPVIVHYSRNVDLKLLENLDVNTRSYRGNLSYMGVYTYSVHYESGEVCSYVYEFTGSSHALRNESYYVVSQTFRLSLKPGVNNVNCGPGYVASGFYLVDGASDTIAKPEGEYSGVEFYEYRSSDRIHLVFNHHLELGDYKLSIHEELNLGGRFSVRLGRRDQAAFIVRIYDFHSITRKSINASIALNTTLLHITGHSSTASGHINERGWYLEFKVSCSIKSNIGGGS